MAKDPAFLFYSSDFLSGTLTMPMEERGQYITLLAVMHQCGRLTIEEMETVLHKPALPGVLRKFKKDSENKYYNERLEAEKSKRGVFVESRRKSLQIDNGDMVHLYLIKDPKGLYKIGSSKYPQLRLKEVIKYNPGSEFYWISPDLHDRINEKQLHDKYADKRERYDWFKLDSKDLENIVRTFRTENENENKNENRILNSSLESQENLSYPIEECLQIALRDERWVRANKTNQGEIKLFNEYLERLGKYALNPLEYKTYFAKLKGKYPDFLKKKYTIEELRILAEQFDKQNLKAV